MCLKNKPSGKRRECYVNKSLLTADSVHVMFVLKVLILISACVSMLYVHGFLCVSM